MNSYRPLNIQLLITNSHRKKFRMVNKSRSGPKTDRLVDAKTANNISNRRNRTFTITAISPPEPPERSPNTKEGFLHARRNSRANSQSAITDSQARRTSVRSIGRSCDYISLLVLKG